MNDDIENAVAKLNAIVTEHCNGERYRFTRALFMRLRMMKFSITTLSTAEGVDAATAIAMAVAAENWMELAQTTSHTLPKTWQDILKRIGGADITDRYQPKMGTLHLFSSNFTNSVRIGSR